jgi:NADH dehydrogenase FAD-containing subunit
MHQLSSKIVCVETIPESTVELNNPEQQNQQINTNTLIWAPRRRAIGIINAKGGHQNRF